MPPLRLWHTLAAVAAAGLLFGAARLDEGPTSCTPVAPVLAVAYVCAGLGVAGARRRGRRARTGFLLGLLLGPIGVIFACSNPVPRPPPGQEISG